VTKNGQLVGEGWQMFNGIILCWQFFGWCGRKKLIGALKITIGILILDRVSDIPFSSVMQRSLGCCYLISNLIVSM
jgi:hypothetical protein